MFSKLIGLALLLVSTSAFAQRTAQLGHPVYLDDCGGYITLNEARNGDLSIQLSGVNTSRCYNLQVSDASSGRVIKSYQIQGTSYTLSHQMLRSLGQDCRVNFRIGGGWWNNDGFVVYIPWCYPQPTYDYPTYPNYPSYPGDYDSDYDFPFPSYPRPSYPIPSYPRPTPIPSYPGQGRVTYEWSNKRNCKKMIDGQYSGQNVADHFCRR